MKHTAKMLAHFSRNYEGEMKYEIFFTDMSKHGYTPICEVEVPFETPDDFNPVSAEIESLRKKQREMRAEAQVKDNEIEARIAELSCLEYRP